MNSSDEREQQATDALNDSAAEIGEEAVAILTNIDVLATYLLRSSAWRQSGLRKAFGICFY